MARGKTPLDYILKPASEIKDRAITSLDRDYFTMAVYQLEELIN